MVQSFSPPAWDSWYQRRLLQQFHYRAQATPIFYPPPPKPAPGGAENVIGGRAICRTGVASFRLDSFCHQSLPTPAVTSIAAKLKAINCNRQFPFRQLLFDSTTFRVERNSASAISKSIWPRTGASTSKCCSACVNQCLTARIFTCVLHPGSGTLFTPWDIISAEVDFSPRKY